MSLLIYLSFAAFGILLPFGVGLVAARGAVAEWKRVSASWVLQAYLILSGVCFLMTLGIVIAFHANPLP